MNKVRLELTLLTINKNQETAKDSNIQLMLLVFGIPIVGLIYCGLGVAAMASLSIVRENALISGLLFILIPFSIAASIWIRASAKAYRN